jgi:glycosyltransferase A (GT-A) superfamily protein (DUF2064 family)
MPLSGAEPACLVLYCRRPEPGVGKQRIAAATDAAFACALQELLLATALEDLRDWPGPVVIAPAAATDRAWAEARCPSGGMVLPQVSGNLGERLLATDASLRASGRTTLVYIGSDAPLLGPSHYATARAALRDTDVVLDPAADGGVTLMGSRVPWPPLADLPWSTAGLGTALEQRCRAAGLSVQRLAGSSDCDEISALPQLAADLAADPRPARQALRQWLLAADWSRYAVAP